ncbi:MAG: hypothetical protein JNJ49_00490 [Bdellovibrionaceae bacterium]|nr:hypothetical protein [Pseudobdellovibrionaceae bacterium]
MRNQKKTKDGLKNRDLQHWLTAIDKKFIALATNEHVLNSAGLTLNAISYSRLLLKRRTP